MSLPSTFCSSSQYFNECAIFLKKYKFLYKYPNTHILLNETLLNISIEGLQNFDLFEENVGFNGLSELNTFLGDFITEGSRFLVARETCVDDDTLEEMPNVPLSQKKKHEILNLSRQVKEICSRSEIGTVVDFGSGLGYLDQQLFDISKLEILGLECNESHHAAAKRRQQKYHEASAPSVRFVQHRITSDSNGDIQRLLGENFPGCGSFCIAGLHACADLTVDAIQLFLKMEKAVAMAVMPCCYHRLEADERSGNFRNFPLSESFKAVHTKYECFEFMTVPFLRLATQPTDCAESLRNLAFNLLARGALQVYAERHNFKIMRNKRKAVRLKAIGNDFKVYLEAACQGYTIQNTCDGVKKTQMDSREISSIWQDIDEMTLKRACLFILLQNYIQPIIENFILYDRIVYLIENGVTNCFFKEILKKNISPRCLLLVAQK